MFQVLTRCALGFNIIHDSIILMLKKMVELKNNNQSVPGWGEFIPKGAEEYLLSRRKIKSLMADLDALMTELSADQRTRIVSYIESQNDISGLLDGTCECTVLYGAYEEVLGKIEGIFEEAFELLRKTKIRNEHYKKIYDSLKSKTCPFCGYMPLDASGLKSEDLDHYLDRQRYPTASANFENLVPTCGKCNSRYKGMVDLIFKGGIRRRALNPYGNVFADVCLRETDISKLEDLSPKWKVKLLPEIEEVNTWNEVYNVRERLLESVLTPNYERTLDEMIDYFMDQDVDGGCTDQQLLEAVDRFYQYKYAHPEQGLGFLKHKIVDIFRYELSRKNQAVFAIIRGGLREPDGGAA